MMQINEVRHFMFYVSWFLEVIVCLNSQEAQSFLYKLEEEFFKGADARGKKPPLRTGGLFSMGECE